MSDGEMMKALLCSQCFDIRALDPKCGTVSCRCQCVTARWLDPLQGTVRVYAQDRSHAFILGLHNGFLHKAVEGFSHAEQVIAGGQWEAWHKLHEDMTHAPGYLFDQSRRGCWAVLIRLGESTDTAWEECVDVDHWEDVPLADEDLLVEAQDKPNTMLLIHARAPYSVSEETQRALLKYRCVTHIFECF